eukprot:gene5729-6017_t
MAEPAGAFWAIAHLPFCETSEESESRQETPRLESMEPNIPLDFETTFERELPLTGVTVGMRGYNREDTSLTALVFSETSSNRDMLHHLVVAASEGNSQLEELIEQISPMDTHAHGADTSHTDEQGRTPLAIACCMSDSVGTRAVEALLSRSYANQPDLQGMLPLHHAAQHNAKSLELLLQTMCEYQEPGWLDVTDAWGRTALSIAAWEGNLASIQRLLKFGADVNFVCKGGRTALHCACRSGHTHVVNALLEAGSHGHLPDAKGRTELYMAAANGHAGVIRALLTSPIWQVDGEDVCRRHDLYSGATPMHVAAEAGHQEAVRALLDCGDSPMVADKDGWLPIHLAANASHCFCVEVLATHPPWDGPEHVNAKNACRGPRYGWSPLTCAVMKGVTCVSLPSYLPMVETLIRLGASVDAPDGRSVVDALVCMVLGMYLGVGCRGARHGWSPLASALMKGVTCVTLPSNLPMVERLIRLGASVDAPDGRSLTPLHHAAKDGSEEVLAVLLKHCQLPISLIGHTPLALAIVGKHTGCMRLLLEASTASEPLGIQDETCVDVLPKLAASAASEPPETLAETSADVLPKTLDGTCIDVLPKLAASAASKPPETLAESCVEVLPKLAASTASEPLGTLDETSVDVLPKLAAEPAEYQAHSAISADGLHRLAVSPAPSDEYKAQSAMYADGLHGLAVGPAARREYQGLGAMYADGLHGLAVGHAPRGASPTALAAAVAAANSGGGPPGFGFLSPLSVSDSTLKAAAVVSRDREAAAEAGGGRGAGGETTSGSTGQAGGNTHHAGAHSKQERSIGSGATSGSTGRAGGESGTKNGIACEITAQAGGERSTGSGSASGSTGQAGGERGTENGIACETTAEAGGEHSTGSGTPSRTAAEAGNGNGAGNGSGTGVGEERGTKSETPSGTAGESAGNGAPSGTAAEAGNGNGAGGERGTGSETPSGITGEAAENGTGPRSGRSIGAAARGYETIENENEAGSGSGTGAGGERGTWSETPSGTAREAAEDEIGAGSGRGTGAAAAAARGYDTIENGRPADEVAAVLPDLGRTEDEVAAVLPDLERISSPNTRCPRSPFAMMVPPPSLNSMPKPFDSTLEPMGSIRTPIDSIPRAAGVAGGSGAPSGTAAEEGNENGAENGRGTRSATAAAAAGEYETLEYGSPADEVTAVFPDLGHASSPNTRCPRSPFAMMVPPPSLNSMPKPLESMFEPMGSILTPIASFAKPETEALAPVVSAACTWRSSCTLGSLVSVEDDNTVRASSSNSDVEAWLTYEGGLERSQGWHYFELEVVNVGETGMFWVGWAASDECLHPDRCQDPICGRPRLIHSEILAASYLIRGSDGNRLDRGHPNAFAPRMSNGDVIGILLNRAARTVSLILNRKYLGIAFSEVTNGLCPPEDSNSDTLSPLIAPSSGVLTYRGSMPLVPGSHLGHGLNGPQGSHGPRGSHDGYSQVGARSGQGGHASHGPHGHASHGSHGIHVGHLGHTSHGVYVGHLGHGGHGPYGSHGPRVSHGSHGGHGLNGPQGSHDGYSHNPSHSSYGGATPNNNNNNNINNNSHERMLSTPSHRRNSSGASFISAHHSCLSDLHALSPLGLPSIGLLVPIIGARMATTLHMASVFGHLSVARVLIKHGADVNATTQYRSKPIILAVRYCHVEVFALSVTSALCDSHPPVTAHSWSTPSLSARTVDLDSPTDG